MNSAKQAHPGFARIWMIESGNWCKKVKIGWIYVNFFAPNENWLADKWNWLPRTKISVPVNEFVCSDSKFEWPNRRASGKCVNLNAHTWIWMRKWWNWPGNLYYYSPVFPSFSSVHSKYQVTLKVLVNIFRILKSSFCYLKMV